MADWPIGFSVTILAYLSANGNAPHGESHAQASLRISTTIATSTVHVDVQNTRCYSRTRILLGRQHEGEGAWRSARCASFVVRELLCGRGFRIVCAPCHMTASSPMRTVLAVVFVTSIAWSTPASIRGLLDIGPVLTRQK